MAELVAKIDVSEEAIRIVEEKIKKALQPLWKAEAILARLIDEEQPPEPYWTPILELHRLICEALREEGL
jgi:hypothetical protein